MTVAEQISAERRLADSLDQYAGQWVAVRHHEIVASATTLEGLHEQIRQEPGEKVEIFRVASDPHVACFY